MNLTRLFFGALGGLAGFLVFRLVTGRMAGLPQGTALATHVAAGIGGVIFLRFMRKP